MIAFLLTRWRFVFPIFLISVMSLYCFSLKTRYTAIASELEALKANIAYQTQIQQVKNDILRKQAESTVKNIISEHKQALIGVGLDRKRVEDKLKGSINEISNELNIYRDAVSVRNSTANSIGVSKVAENTIRSTEASGNCNQTLATVVDACKVTDYDYEALYNLYQKQCDIYGCE